MADDSEGVARGANVEIEVVGLRVVGDGYGEGAAGYLR